MFGIWTQAVWVLNTISLALYDYHYKTLLRGMVFQRTPFGKLPMTLCLLHIHPLWPLSHCTATISLSTSTFRSYWPTGCLELEKGGPSLRHSAPIYWHTVIIKRKINNISALNGTLQGCAVYNLHSCIQWSITRPWAPVPWGQYFIFPFGAASS